MNPVLILCFLIIILGVGFAVAMWWFPGERG